MTTQLQEVHNSTHGPARPVGPGRLALKRGLGTGLAVRRHSVDHYVPEPTRPTNHRVANAGAHSP